MVRSGHRLTTQHARRAGFTLTELMIVVAVIAISAGLAAPAMYTGFANRRTQEASLDLVQLATRGRAEAGAYGRAHLLRFDNSGGNGQFALFRGTSSLCAANDWATLSGGTAVGRIDLETAGGRYTTGSMTILATDSEASGLVDICYEPTGRVMWRLDVADAFSEVNTAAIQGGFVFTFQRQDGGTDVGVARRVAIPLGGNARVML